MSGTGLPGAVPAGLSTSWFVRDVERRERQCGPPSGPSLGIRWWGARSGVSTAPSGLFANRCSVVCSLQHGSGGKTCLSVAGGFQGSNRLWPWGCRVSIPVSESPVRLLNTALFGYQTDIKLYKHNTMLISDMHLLKWLLGKSYTPNNFPAILIKVRPQNVPPVRMFLQLRICFTLCVFLVNTDKMEKSPGKSIRILCHHHPDLSDQ